MGKEKGKMHENNHSVMAANRCTIYFTLDINRSLP